MRKERKIVPLESLQINKGQLAWLPRNPRQWTKKDVDAMVKSLDEDPDFMEDRPPLTTPGNSPDVYVTFGGNMRTEAEKKRKAVKGVEVVIYYPETEEDYMTIIRRASKDNGSYGAWDYDTLANEWGSFPLTDWGVPDWDAKEVGGGQPDVQEDNFDEDKDEIHILCQKGDIWQLGEHRLMCGDSVDTDCVAKLMNGHKADLVFTDPPYGVEYQSNSRERTEKFDKIKNDDTMLDFIPALKPYVGGFVFVCASWKNVDKWIVYFKEHYPFTNMVVWNKGGGSMGDLKHSFGTDYELILVSNNGQELKGKRIGSVWSVGRDNGNDYLHPTQKPVNLSAIAIENTTDAGGIVADVFGGSGSTLIACEQLNRRCFMMELDEHYCDVIIARWEKLTGKQAMKIN